MAPRNVLDMSSLHRGSEAVQVYALRLQFLIAPLVIAIAFAALGWMALSDGDAFGIVIIAYAVIAVAFSGIVVIRRPRIEIAHDALTIYRLLRTERIALRDVLGARASFRHQQLLRPQRGPQFVAVAVRDASRADGKRVLYFPRYGGDVEAMVATIVSRARKHGAALNHEWLSQESIEVSWVREIAGRVASLAFGLAVVLVATQTTIGRSATEWATYVFSPSTAPDWVAVVVEDDFRSEYPEIDVRCPDKVSKNPSEKFTCTVRSADFPYVIANFTTKRADRVTYIPSQYKQ